MAEKGQQLHQVAKTWSPYDRMPESSRGFINRIWQRLGFSRELATLARYEMDMGLLRISCKLSPRFRRQVKELAGRRGLRIHIGCGNVLLPDWINVDCYPPDNPGGAEMLTLDMRPGLPFAGGSARAIYSEHFFEHVPFELARHGMLPDLFRMLEPGGVIRLGVPDGEYFARQYLAEEEEPLHRESRGERTKMMMLNDLARAYTHRFLWDYETFAMVLAECGFSSIRRAYAHDSEIGDFADKDRQDPWRERHTLYLEARKPE